MLNRPAAGADSGRDTGQAGVRPAIHAGSESAASEPHRTWIEVAGWMLVYRVVYFGMLLLATWMLPQQYNSHLYLSDYHSLFANPPVTWSRFFITWDAEHYLAISRVGYRGAPENQAFFPLWPLLIRAGSYFLGGTIASGVILANLLSVAAVTVLYRYLQGRFGRSLADRCIILLLAMPASVFFAVPYSEALYLLLSALCITWLDSGRPALSGAAAFLAAITRPVGIFWVLVFAAAAWSRKQPRLLLLCLFPAAGYATFLAILAVQTGNPLGQFSAIRGYANGASPANFVNILGFIHALVTIDPEHSYGHSPIDRLFFVWLLASLLPTFRRDKILFAYSVAFGVMPAIATLFISYSRYVLIAFPMLLVTAEYLRPPKRLPAFAVLIAGLLMLQMIFLILHVNNSWAG